MKKRCLYLAAAFFLIISSVIPVHAEDYTAGSGWEVKFTGDKMESNFKSSDITEAVGSLQPGDSVEFRIALKNTGKDATDWYMSNAVLSSLEDSQSVAEGGAYTYALIYTDGAGSRTTLYDSDSVGGEKTSSIGEGLHEATDSLDEFFYLDTLKEGDASSVLLRVALDGETQGNAYQDTLARIQLNFAVEKSPTDRTRAEREENNVIRTRTPSSSSNVYSLEGVQTGDQSDILLWSALALISGLILLILALILFRRTKGGNEYE